MLLFSCYSRKKENYGEGGECEKIFSHGKFVFTQCEQSSH